MDIGFIGLGKLGLPCALAIDSTGKHKVRGYDINEEIKTYLDDKSIPYQEKGSQELLDNHTIDFLSMSEVINKSEIIFVPIQTPHDPLYEGITRLPNERVDFDYSYLIDGLKQISLEIEKQQTEKIVVIISTVLPGTVTREIKPFLSKYIRLCYNPFFIAMGTTINDFTNPEFVLLGVDDKDAAETVKNLYSTIHSKEVYECTIEEAELIKVSYNTFITMKICLANTVTEVSHKLNNINSDVVMQALTMADERLISDKYLRGGMGDGGACHPRDNIALSWLAREIDLSYDWYENLMISREKHTEWLANLCIEYSEKTGLEIMILGRSFKKESNLITGSPSYLLKNILKEKQIEVSIHDPYIDKETLDLKTPKLFFIGTDHDVFKNYVFPEGSTVIDPWRIIDRNEQFDLISVGNSY